MMNSQKSTTCGQEGVIDRNRARKRLLHSQACERQHIVEEIRREYFQFVVAKISGVINNGGSNTRGKVGQPCCVVDLHVYPMLLHMLDLHCVRAS